MKKIEKLEDIEAWQLARNLTSEIYKLTFGFPKEEKYVLTPQLRSSTLSISANIAESYGRFHYLTKINFLYNARGSLEETKSHLIIACDLKYISIDILNNLLDKLKTIQVKINNLITTTYKQTKK